MREIDSEKLIKKSFHSSHLTRNGRVKSTLRLSPV
jgi:hypothetical protein